MRTVNGVPFQQLLSGFNGNSKTRMKRETDTPYDPMRSWGLLSFPRFFFAKRPCSKLFTFASERSDPLLYIYSTHSTFAWSSKFGGSRARSRVNVNKFRAADNGLDKNVAK